MYIFLCTGDDERMREVEEQDVNLVFKEALGYDKTLMITQTVKLKKGGLWRKDKTIPHFTIYHECLSDFGKPTYQAAMSMAGSGDKRVTLAYLYGIINGARAKLKHDGKDRN